jgi:glycosyltransferase involved in cell wall biosynthesis
VDFTVAICTWNHAQLLRQTLHQFLQLRQPGDVSWELIVVNNNCTDHTDAVIAEYTSRLPIRRVFQSKPGLSNARNAAVAAAAGSFILWTDDDVLVSPGWLEAYAAALRKNPHVDIMGGPIEPWFEGNPPHWLARSIDVVAGAYAVRDTASSSGPFGGDNLPYGANMAIRRTRQLEFPFDPALGRSQGNMLGCEELDVMKQILGAGGHGVWVPEARVRHFISRSRQSLGYLWRYWRGNGLTAASIATNRGRFRVLGNPGWLWAQAASSLFWWAAGLAIHPPERWLTQMRSAAASVGRLQGAWHRG